VLFPLKRRGEARLLMFLPKAVRLNMFDEVDTNSSRSSFRLVVKSFESKGVLNSASISAIAAFVVIVMVESESKKYVKKEEQLLLAYYEFTLRSATARNGR